MKKVSGLWLPDGDEHFTEARLAGPRVGGLPTYQHRKFRKALGYVRDFRFAIDVGAHVGLWTNVLARNFKRVAAFEPLAVHRECWQANVGKLKNATLFPFALGASAGKVNIFMPEDNTGHSHASHDGEVGEWCDMRTLDSFEVKCCDLIKIDVEGLELRVVEGAENTIRLFRPIVIVEQKADNAEAQGWDQYAARDLLLSWGMKELAVDLGDHIMGWD